MTHVIKETNITDLVETLFPGYWEKKLFLQMPFAEVEKEVQKYLDRRTVYYYSRKKEQFSLHEGIKLTVKAGCSEIVYESK